ncbi:MAG: hypothetical protein QOK25_130 [Thermoleophilaceae bacterium]|nr:hypothetical protein [Thermoleophilaceae bacterium]
MSRLVTASRPIRRLLITTFLAAGLALCAAQPALATNWVVTKTADTDDGTCDSDCSLREAVGSLADSSTGDSITIPAGHYVLSLGELNVDADATITGAGARSTIIDANGTSRVLHFQGDTKSTLSGVTVTGGKADATSAGTANDGGGIFVSTPSLILNDVTVTKNTAVFSGGGIATSGSFETLTGDELTMSGSTVSDNHVTGGIGNGQGGGIAVFGPLTITNSTISGNSVDNPGISEGGGIVSGAPFGGGTDTTTLLNTTISGNSVTGTGASFGAGLSGDDPGNAPVQAQLDAKNTIIAGNTANGTTQDCGLVNTTSTDHNLSSDSTCGFSDAGSKQDTNPLLGPLQDNGGQTDTRALLPGSPAINTGTNSGCPGTDQRGITRPQVVTCDIGAFELVFQADLAVTKSAPTSVTLGNNLVYTLTVTNNGPQPAAGVTLTDALPLAAVSIAPAGLCSGTPLSCNIGDLAVGASRTITVTTKPSKTGKLTNTASVTGTYADPNPANNSATVTTTVKKPALPLAIAGVGGSCRSGDFNVRASTSSKTALKSLRVLVDGRSIGGTKKHSLTVRVRVGGLRSGRHSLTAQATDRFGTKRTRTSSFFVCPRSSPRFTG